VRLVAEWDTEVGYTRSNSCSPYLRPNLPATPSIRSRRLSRGSDGLVHRHAESSSNREGIRYVAERHEVAVRHAEWEITGPPKIRDVDPGARYFTPWKVVPHAELVRIEE